MRDAVCSFCQNIVEDGFDVVARGEHILAVLDRHPINRGHVLVIPLRHAPDLASLTADEVTELALIAQAADRAIRDVLASTTTGTNLVMSNGEDADQGTPHAHLHVIPRQPGDGYEFREDATRYPLEPLSDAERDALRARLRPVARSQEEVGSTALARKDAPMFSSTVVDHWVPAVARSHTGADVVVAVDSGLPENRSVSLLRIQDGPAILAVSPEKAERLSVSDGDDISHAELVARLKDAGVTLNDPDNLFYLPAAERDALRSEAPRRETRELTAADAAAFAELTARAPEDDLDEAFVELDHWLVFGTFAGDTLASAASMYPWSGSRLADLGVITLPDYRGQGLARATVRAMSAAAIARGYEPQYRCQLDNTASVALAKTAGFRLFGEWEVIDADD